MKSNSPNTSLIVIFFSIQISNSKTIQNQNWCPLQLYSESGFYFSLKFEIKMKRHKEKTFKVICF